MSATIEEALRCLTDVGEPITHVQAQLIAAEVERLKAELSMSRENALRAERDAALALADATQAELNAERARHHATATELNKAVTWLDRCAWARSVIDLDAGPLEVQLAEALGRVERLTKLMNEVEANCGCTDETDIPCANCLRIDEFKGETP